MSDHSAIEWTDATWNPTTGCTKISPGCAHCYIERTPAFRIAGNTFVRGKTDIAIFHDRLEQPLHWRKPRRVFVNSLSDLFHDDISDAFIDRVFAVMALAPQHTFQVLTKRADRMLAYLTGTADGWGRAARIADAAQKSLGFDGAKYKPMKPPALPSADVFWMGSCNPPDQPYRERWILKTWPLNNVWLGVSVENQHFADERIPLLLQTPAAVRFISAEPLLGPVDIEQWLIESVLTDSGWHTWPKLDWVIVGGESGPRARLFRVEWARSIIAQCKATGVPCFMKQLGDNPISALGLGGMMRASKRGDPDEWPEDLRVRQYPEART